MEVDLDFEPDKPYATKGVLSLFVADDPTPIHSDQFDLANSNRREAFVKKAIEKCKGLDSETLDKAILSRVGEIIKAKRIADEAAEAPPEPERDPLEETPAHVRKAALSLLQSGDLFEQISADIEAIGIAGEESLRLMLYIVMTSRLLDRPLSAIVQGASASGKSYIIETVAKLMPPEGVVQAHDFSDQALFYLEEGSFHHKIVISGERLNEKRGKDGFAEDNTKAFREMVSSGELRKAVTVKGSDGKHTTKVIYQPGPIAFCESSTAPNIHDEDATRLLPLVTDESAEQTEKVVEAQRREAKGLAVSKARKQEIILLHHTMQRLLKPFVVRVPFIDSMSLPGDNIATRRTFQQFRYAIASVALLRQYQKQKKSNEETGERYIAADEIDYTLAHRLMAEVLDRKYTPLNQQSLDLLGKAQDQCDPDKQFTLDDCAKWIGQSESSARRRLKPLVSCGIVEVDAATKPYKYKVIRPDLAKVAELNLPKPEEIAERIAIMSE